MPRYRFEFFEAHEVGEYKNDTKIHVIAFEWKLVGIGGSMTGHIIDKITLQMKHDLGGS